MVSTPLKNMLKSVGIMIIPNVMGKSKKTMVPNHQPVVISPLKIVDLPIKSGGSFHRYVTVYQRVLVIINHD